MLEIKCLIWFDLDNYKILYWWRAICYNNAKKLVLSNILCKLSRDASFVKLFNNNTNANWLRLLEESHITIAWLIEAQTANHCFAMKHVKCSVMKIFANKIICFQLFVLHLIFITAVDCFCLSNETKCSIINLKMKFGDERQWYLKCTIIRQNKTDLTNCIAVQFVSCNINHILNSNKG